VFNYLRAGFKHRETRQNGVASVKIYSAILLLPIVKCKMISENRNAKQVTCSQRGSAPRLARGAVFKIVRDGHHRGPSP